MFASVLERDSLGQYWLVTPTETGRVEVEDVPFLAVELFHARPECGQVISFRTNVDEIVTVDADHPLYVAVSDPIGPAPYVVVRPGIAARLSRPVYYELVDIGVFECVGDVQVFGVWSSRSFFPLDSPGDAP